MFQQKGYQKALILHENAYENIAARAGQDSKRVGIGIISVLDKVFSKIAASNQIYLN